MQVTTRTVGGLAARRARRRSNVRILTTGGGPAIVSRAQPRGDRGRRGPGAPHDRDRHGYGRRRVARSGLGATGRWLPAGEIREQNAFNNNDVRVKS